ncbi:MAG: hypothetical protein GXY77_01115 [Fibrobacter sp.]|nr:hypothetical protein [Fibrobacter sp.]
MQWLCHVWEHNFIIYSEIDKLETARFQQFKGDGFLRHVSLGTDYNSKWINLHG